MAEREPFDWVRSNLDALASQLAREEGLDPRTEGVMETMRQRVKDTKEGKSGASLC